MEYKFYVHDTGFSKHLMISTEPEVSQLCELLMCVSNFALNWYIENINKVLRHEVDSAGIGNNLVIGTVYHDVTHIKSAFSEHEPDVEVIDTVLLRKIIVEFRDEYIKIKNLDEKYSASGYFYEGVPWADGRIKPETKSPLDRFGGYTAKVTVNGIAKKGKGLSSFFPKNYTPEQVIDAINEAYDTRMRTAAKNIFFGYSISGLQIIMYLDENEKIASAFPIYQS